MPNLLQYVSNSNYYGRIKVSGKTIRESLNTDVWTTAKLRLLDFLKKQKGNRERIVAPLFTEPRLRTTRTARAQFAHSAEPPPR